MDNKKQDKAMMVDPNRFKIAKNMSVMPGGPMNNNPMNVTSLNQICLLYTSPSPRDRQKSRMPSSA